MNRQHLLAATLTSANGLVLLFIVSVAGLLPGYGVAAIALLSLQGFVLHRLVVIAGRRIIFWQAGESLVPK